MMQLFSRAHHNQSRLVIAEWSPEEAEQGPEMAGGYSRSIQNVKFRPHAQDGDFRTQGLSVIAGPG